MLTTLAQTLDKTLWMPHQGSTFADAQDWTFYFIYWVSVFFFVLVGICMFWFAWRYRQTDKNKVAHGMHHSTALEVTWSVIPLIILLAIFMWGFRGFLDMTTPPGEAYEITVVSRKWSWEFQYPEGAVSGVLHVPADTPVHLVLQSDDVIHSFFVPAFRVKMDAVPGRYNKTWFQATWNPERAGPVQVQIPGTENYEEYDNVLAYDLFCAEYCGTRHSMMVSSVVVHTPQGFAKWLEDNTSLTGTPVEIGQQLYQTRGCAACHSTDGSAKIGPTFRDLFGRDSHLTDGSTVTADEAYIRESILNPGAQIVQGYQNVMPRVTLQDNEISALIAWMKSISQHHQGQMPTGEDGDVAPSQEPGENPLPPQDQPTLDEARSVPSEDRPDQGVELQGQDQTVGNQ